MTKERKQEIISTYRRDEKDTGSSEVQIALLTERITELTEHLKETRIRCIIKDNDDNIWICAYNNNKGLVKYNDSTGITSYTEENGFIDNGVRCCACRVRTQEQDIF